VGIITTVQHARPSAGIKILARDEFPVYCDVESGTDYDDRMPTEDKICGMVQTDGPFGEYPAKTLT
jgi:hypothetical protein